MSYNYDEYDDYDHEGKLYWMLFSDGATWQGMVVESDCSLDIIAGVASTVSHRHSSSTEEELVTLAFGLRSPLRICIDLSLRLDFSYVTNDLTTAHMTGYFFC